MHWLLHGLWAYRQEILLAIQLLAKVRKTAAQVAREYLRRQVETKLRRSIAIVGIEIALFALAITVGSARFSSLVLWAVTLYNLTELFFFTLPELRALHRTLKSKAGYALKLFLEVSFATELMRLNVLFLLICLFLGISTRTYLGSHFSYFQAWKQKGQTSLKGKGASGARYRQGSSLVPPAEWEQDSTTAD